MKSGKLPVVYEARLAQVKADHRTLDGYNVNKKRTQMSLVFTGRAFSCIRERDMRCL